MVKGKGQEDQCAFFKLGFEGRGMGKLHVLGTSQSEMEKMNERNTKSDKKLCLYGGV